MFLIFIFNVFFCTVICIQLYLNNTYIGEVQDGTFNSPFNSIQKLLNSSNIGEYLEIELIIMSNLQNYTINDSFTLNYSLKIIFSSENKGRAGLVVYFDKFIIETNGILTIILIYI